MSDEKEKEHNIVVSDYKDNNIFHIFAFDIIHDITMTNV